MEILTKSQTDTKNLGKKLGANLAKSGSKAKTPRIIALKGDLGSGKTTFTQGFAKGLGIKGRIVSPTFILMRKYESGSNSSTAFYHLDLYRLEGDVNVQLKDLGVLELWSDPKNVLLIEWADKATIIPRDAEWINFERLSNNMHKITLSAKLAKFIK